MCCCLKKLQNEEETTEYPAPDAGKMARKQKDSKKVYQDISSMRNQLCAETENADKCPDLIRMICKAGTEKDMKEMRSES
jgi:hypothetical protein